MTWCWVNKDRIFYFGVKLGKEKYFNFVLHIQRTTEKVLIYSTGTYNFQAAPENLRPVGFKYQAFWSATNGKFSNDQPQSQPWQICRCLPPAGAWTAWNRWGLWSILLNRDPMCAFSLSGGWKLLFEHVDSLAISHICRHEWDWLCYECSDKLLAAVCLFARRKWVEFISGFICGFNSLTKTVCVVDVQMCPNADKNCVSDYNLW